MSATAAARQDSVLELRGIGKDFGAIRALSDVDLAIAPGEVVGLMGDNGAGKSTLVKIIAGNFHPTHGTLRLDGTEHRFDRPLDARAAGIEVVYQDLALADNVSAAANVFLGRELTRRVGPFRFLDHRAMNARALDLFGELKSETRPRDLVRSMSGGQRQAVAIARTRLAKAKLILMDEPTAAISVRQVAEVLDLIRRLRDGGRGGDPHLAPHARRVQRLRPCGRPAPRHQMRRQGDRGVEPRGGDRPSSPAPRSSPDV